LIALIVPGDSPAFAAICSLLSLPYVNKAMISVF